MKIGDKIIVRMYGSSRMEIKTRSHGQVFTVKEQGGKLGIDWNTERSPYLCRGDIFTPFSSFSGTSVTFEDVTNGDKYHYSAITEDIEKGPCYYEERAKPETLEEKEARIFDHYKHDLIKLHEQHQQIRFNVIEYMCSFPDIDPVKMGAALMLDGYNIVFDDSSISKTKNDQKRHFVEQATGLNSMCFKCSSRCHGCNGTTNKLWSGCIYKNHPEAFKEA